MSRSAALGDGCDRCGSASADRVCTSCRSVVYCDPRCQRVAWLHHKEMCVAIWPSLSSLHARSPTCLRQAELGLTVLWFFRCFSRAGDAAAAVSHGEKRVIAKPQCASGFLDRDFHCWRIVSSPVATSSGIVLDATVGAALQTRIDRFSSIGVMKSGAWGRGIVALRDLKRGELVLDDEALAAVVHPEYSAVICHYCFRRHAGTQAAVVRCEDCNEAAWCSSECKSAAAEMHAPECEALQQFPAELRPRLHGVRLFTQIAASTDPATITAHSQGPAPSGAAEMEKLADMADGVNRVIPAIRRPSREQMVGYIARVHTNAFIVTDPDGRRLGSGYLT